MTKESTRERKALERAGMLGTLAAKQDQHRHWLKLLSAKHLFRTAKDRRTQKETEAEDRKAQMVFERRMYAANRAYHRKFRTRDDMLASRT